MRRLAYWLKTGAGPWVVWLSCVAAVLWLFADMGSRAPVIGFAQSDRYEVAPLDAGRVTAVTVEVGQEIEEGQVLAMLDTAAIDSAIAVQESQRQEIQARIRAERARVERRNAEDVQTLRHEAHEAAVELARARGQVRAVVSGVNALAGLRARETELLASGFGDRRQIADLDLRAATLRATAGSDYTAVTLLEQSVARATELAESALAARDAEITVGPLIAKLSVIDKRIEQLRSTKRGLVLRAPVAGIVGQIMVRAGDVARPGEAVLALVGHRADRIVACMSERYAMDVQIGSAATLQPRGQMGVSLRAHVVALGPIVDQVPLRCRPDPRIPAWGRDVILVLDEPAELLPGQGFEVFIERAVDTSGTAHAAKQATRPTDAGTAPQSLQVPDALTAVTRFEPSAAVWVPRMKRYVILSDDTGLADSSEHRPWIFSMDAAGRVDSKPLEIEGLDAVSDLEALALAREGRLYITTSQGLSRKGNRPRARQVFARLGPTESGYRLEGQVALASALEAAGPEMRSSLGVKDLDALEIEGMTWMAGTLYLGLKSPLDAQGRALIWRATAPDRLLEGDLPGSGLELWARVKLIATADGATVGGGISAMLSLPDGSLVLGSTPSVGDPQAVAGSMWHVTRPVRGELAARFVRNFEGLKPEGLSLSSRPGRLAVFFDAGDAAPTWLELPWPAGG